MKYKDLLCILGIIGCWNSKSKCLHMKQNSRSYNMNPFFSPITHLDWSHRNFVIKTPKFDTHPYKHTDDSKSSTKKSVNRKWITYPQNWNENTLETRNNQRSLDVAIGPNEFTSSELESMINDINSGLYVKAVEFCKKTTKCVDSHVWAVIEHGFEVSKIKLYWAFIRCLYEQRVSSEWLAPVIAFFNQLKKHNLIYDHPFVFDNGFFLYNTVKPDSDLTNYLINVFAQNQLPDAINQLFASSYFSLCNLQDTLCLQTVGDPIIYTFDPNLKDITWIKAGMGKKTGKGTERWQFSAVKDECYDPIYTISSFALQPGANNVSYDLLCPNYDCRTNGVMHAYLQKSVIGKRNPGFFFSVTDQNEPHHILLAIKDRSSNLFMYFKNTETTKVLVSSTPKYFVFKGTSTKKLLGKYSFF